MWHLSGDIYANKTAGLRIGKDCGQKKKQCWATELDAVFTQLSFA